MHTFYLVLNELEGIAKGARKDEKVSENARYALTFLMNRSSCANIKCVTTRGSVLTSTRFTSEEDYSKVRFAIKLSQYCFAYIEEK